MNAKSIPNLPRTQAMILAGGQGERLFPLTVNRPKPAISFGGIFRIIDFTLSNCLHSKLSRVGLLTQYRHEEMHSYIRQGWRDLWIRSGHTPETLVCLPPTSGKTYRGTADAVYQNLSVLDSDRPDCVLVLSGDHVYHMDYREVLAQHRETGADVTIATIEYPLKDASHFGVVEVDEEFRVIGFEEKPLHPLALPARPDRALVSMGVYAFKTETLIRSLLENCEREGNDFGHDVIPSLIRSRRVYAYDFRDAVEDSPRYWRDIGTIDSYYDASMDLLQPDSAFNPYLNDGVAAQITRHPLALGRNNGCSLRARIHSDSHVARSVLSPDVRIERGAIVEDSVLMPGARVGAGALIHRAIIEEGVQIPGGTRIGCDADEDRKHYTVSPAGVVVVSEAPRMIRKLVPFKSVAYGDATPAVA